MDDHVPARDDPAPVPPTRAPEPRHVVVVADGDVPSRAALDAAWPGWADDAAEVIAADGGLAKASLAGLRPTMLVGDLDSLEPARLAEAEASGLPIHRAPVAKDESDAELALLDAIGRGAARVTVLGAFGGPRLDHELANVWLLAHPALAGAEVVLLDARSRVRLIVAPGPDGRPVTRPLPGPPGTTISLLPLGADVRGITTRGLRFQLNDEPLALGPARGLSNVRVAPDAAITVRTGRLLVVETAPAGGGLSSGA
jgi:thiamine pyrophosphokinase